MYIYAKLRSLRPTATGSKFFVQNAQNNYAKKVYKKKGLSSLFFFTGILSTTAARG